MDSKDGDESALVGRANSERDTGRRGVSVGTVGAVAGSAGMATPDPDR